MSTPNPLQAATNPWAPDYTTQTWIAPQGFGTSAPAPAGALPSADPSNPNYASNVISMLQGAGAQQVAAGADPRYTIGTPQYEGMGAEQEDQYKKQLGIDAGQVSKDLESGDYSDAFKVASALGADPALGGNAQEQHATQSMLTSLLDTAQGVQALTPGMNWTPEDVQNYYKAAYAPNSGALNLDPYGETGIGDTNTMQWGSPTSEAAYAQKNITAGGAPDLGRYGANQGTQSFEDKWIMPAIQTIMSLEAPGLMTAMNAANGAENGQNVGQIIGNAAISLGGQALPFGTVVDGALSGAARAAINGGNIGTGAESGAISGLASGAIGDLTGSQFAGNLSGTIAGNLASKYLNPTQPISIGQPPGSLPPAPKPSSAAPTPIAAGTATPPGTAQTQVITNNNTPPPPVQAPAPSQPGGAIATSTPTSDAQTSPYGGLGYQPYRQTGPVANPYTYGQGPEQAMFVPVGS